MQQLKCQEIQEKPVCLATLFRAANRNFLMHSKKIDIENDGSRPKTNSRNNVYGRIIFMHKMWVCTSTYMYTVCTGKYMQVFYDISSIN